VIRFLEELDGLRLPLGGFAIFGSGPLAVRGLRANEDLDVLVVRELWDELARKYPLKQKPGLPESIRYKNVQILEVHYADWRPLISNPEVLIADAELIEGRPYVRLDLLLTCKKLMLGAKHARDVELILNHLKREGRVRGGKSEGPKAGC
jgi:hypothetical protein